MDNDKWITYKSGEIDKDILPTQRTGADNDGILPPGWYYWDPFGDSYGPFGTKTEVEDALQKHVIY